MKKILHTAPALLLAMTLALVSSAFADSKLVATANAATEPKPSVIRIGTPAGGYGKPFTTGDLGTVHALGLFEEEFKRDGIAIEWNFLKSTGPGINESFANDTLDFANIGDLPAIAGRAGGLKTRLVAAGGRGTETYVIVPGDSRVTSVKDLRGKKIGVQKGTYMHAAMDKILHDFGLTEKDLRVLNMDNATMQNAIASKDIDAAFATSVAFDLRNRGVAKIIYSTQTAPESYKNVSAILVSDQFARKYPGITRRLVKVYVKAAVTAAKNRNESFKLWTKAGSPLATLKEDFNGKTIQFITSPKIDEHLITHYRDSIKYYQEIGLIRKNVDLDKWIDRSFIDAAIKELKAENVWPDYDKNGKPKK